MDIKKKVMNIPSVAGVYIMKDEKGEVLYVGKAASLKKRLLGHLSKKDSSAKNERIISKLKDIEYITTPSESQALLLEASLIKEYHPRYNVRLRDDKSYPYVKITKDEYPRIYIARPKKKDGAKYIGPFTNVKLLREALKAIRKIFGFCIYKRFRRSCLYYRIDLCPGPCLGEISKKEYLKNIRNIRALLEGRQDRLIQRLTHQMQRKAKRLEFERAAKLRNQIQALSSLRGNEGEVSILDTTKGLEELKVTFKLPRLPKRIEAFDVSNMLGKQATASMVSFFNGSPDKNNYRRFRIKTVKSIDDYKMLKEVLLRRYRRIKEEGLKFPDLLLIDGGKGHLGVASEALEELKVCVPILSIAKEKERVFSYKFPQGIKLKEDSPALRLLQRLRNEAHRFALKYHHILRRKRIIGERRKRAIQPF